MLERLRLVLLAALAAASVPCRAEEAAPRLMGIVVAGPLRQATFADPAGGAAQMVREGEQIGPWRVARITTGEVSLENGSSRRTLQPGADPTVRPAAALLIDPNRRETDTENDQ